MATVRDLRRTLTRIDGRGYRAYREIAGPTAFPGFTLHVDRVQADPFAAPSRVRTRVPQSRARLPAELFRNRVRRIALEDFLARALAAAIRNTARGRRGSGASGAIRVDAGGQEVIERTAARVTPDWVEARLEVGLPAAGRRILGREAESMLCEELPRIVERGLLWENLPRSEAAHFVECVENQEAIRSQLDSRGLVAFVGDGAVLPRESGVSDRPLPEGAVPFRSPDSLRVSFEVPNPMPTSEGEVSTLSGMGIPRGVTLVVGGGYHGKSTLLRALERGVYPQVPGDGREWVVTVGEAVAVRAEDGRRVEGVDISPFIGDLPGGLSTSAFSTDDASGSTSQAANLVEACEMGATALLLDEDTSATNFMVRDARMQALIRSEDEPIIPFVDRVRDLAEAGVSTVLVMGGCGDYFDVADTVIALRDYRAEDATERAREVARSQPSRRRREASTALRPPRDRAPERASFDASRGRHEVKIDAKALDRIEFGRQSIDLRAVTQVVDRSQTRAIGHAIWVAATRFVDGKATLRQAAEAIDALIDREGIDALGLGRRGEGHPGNLARPRVHELTAAINRLRSLRVASPQPSA